MPNEIALLQTSVHVSVILKLTNWCEDDLDWLDSDLIPRLLEILEILEILRNFWFLIFL